MSREINLVPDIKAEMLKALRMRNIILFVCIVVSIAGASVAAIFALIMGGQQLALDSKSKTLDTMSSKLSSYSDLGEFLTIKNQIDGIDSLTSNKKVLSRTFGILAALIPTGDDSITISKLDVNLTGTSTNSSDFANGNPTLSFEAYANAGKEPYIDYKVLEAFKKSMQFMYYDYGSYVDKTGATIPAYCMIEAGQDGATFSDPEKGRYAYWTIEAEGCNPSAQSDSTDSSDSTSSSSATSSTKADAPTYTTESYEGQTVVKIWRTPQFDSWYKTTQKEGEPYMSLDGRISGVEHFESQCISYTGNIGADATTPKWVDNKLCQLVPDGVDGIVISNSSNGRDSGNELVLRFSAVITLDPKAYEFVNTHMLAIPPTGRRNVTDSYVQVQSMFGERAKDCKEDDTDCSASTNTGTNTDTDNNTNGGNNG